jgi:pilus assembly protein CpaB
MKSLILIFIALGCGLVASIGISQVMNRDAGAGNMELEQILVALADIDIGTKLDAQNVKLEDWPKAKIPEGALRRLEDVKDKFANARFFKGEALHISKVADTLSNIAIKVPAGYRAMQIKVDEDTVLKSISPGDRVDVMVFLRRNGNDIVETGAFTILKNVRVFAVNTNTERANESKGETAAFRTVSLLVKPDHARELTVAAQMGKIMLTLRRPDEIDEAAGEEVTPLSEILSGKAKIASDPFPSSSSPPQGSGFTQLLSAAAGDPAPAASVAVKPAWEMEVMSPTERKKYEWTDLKQLPTETVLGTAAPATPAAAPVSNRSATGGSATGDSATGGSTKGTDKTPTSGDDATNTSAKD